MGRVPFLPCSERLLCSERRNRQTESPQRRPRRIWHPQQHRGPVMIGLDRLSSGRVEEVPGGGYRNDNQNADPDEKA